MLRAASAASNESLNIAAKKSWRQAWQVIAPVAAAYQRISISVAKKKPGKQNMAAAEIIKRKDNAGNSSNSESMKSGICMAVGKMGEAASSENRRAIAYQRRRRKS